MTAHTPDFLTELGTTYTYVEHIGSQLAALIFESVTCTSRVPCIIHSATMSRQAMQAIVTRSRPLHSWLAVKTESAEYKDRKQKI